MWRIRQTWTEWESPWHAYGHALLPRFSLPTIIIIDTIGQTFSTRARGDSGRNRKARRRRTVEISYVTLNDSEQQLAESRGGFCSSENSVYRSRVHARFDGKS